MPDKPVLDMIDALDGRAKDKFAGLPAIIPKDDIFDVKALPINEPEWHSLTDVVCVMSDMKDSTKLDERRKPASTASIYDAGVGGVVTVYEQFDADFVDIQGDGAFALFWGSSRYERALCTAITVKSFSTLFTKRLLAKWPTAPSTGFKVGIANGAVLAKRVGVPRHLDMQEPVWAGKPVNYAAKCAQETEPEYLVITGSVWDAIADNEYLVYSCGCSDGTYTGEFVALWEDIDITRLPDPDTYGRKLRAYWCSNHGNQFCEAVLAGEKVRTDLSAHVRQARAALYADDATRAGAAHERKSLAHDVENDLRRIRLERSRRRFGAS